MKREDMIKQQPPHMLEYWLDEYIECSETLEEYIDLWIQHDSFVKSIYQDIVKLEVSINALTYKAENRVHTRLMNDLGQKLTDSFDILVHYMRMVDAEEGELK